MKLEVEKLVDDDLYQTVYLIAEKPVVEKGADQFSWKVDEPQVFAPEDPNPVGAAGHTTTTGMTARPEHWF